MVKIPRAHGFSLIELMIVLSIIVVLSSLVYPVFSMVRNGAKGIRCSANMRQIYFSFSVYQEGYEGLWPAIVQPYGGWGNAYWNIILFDNDNGYESYYRNQILVRRSIFACPQMDELPILSDWSIAGYGMCSRLPPSVIATPYATAVLANPRFNQIRVPSTTPLVGCTFKSRYSVSVGSPQGSIHLNGLQPVDQSQLLNYSLNGSANVLMADGHVVRGSISAVSKEIVVQSVSGILTY